MADQVLQEIKDRLNVADVIASYIPVKKSGASFKALCPFHHEKSPSFQISPQKQIWHCFGCFPPGQKVKTPFGLHNIEEIDEKHFVYSGQGNIRRVLATHKRNFKGNLVSVAVRKLGGIVSMTEDHHLEVVRPKTKYKKSHKQFYRQCREGVRKGKFANISKAAAYFGDVIKISAGELKTTDFVLFPINDSISKCKTINLKTYLNKVYTFGPRPKDLAYEIKINPELLKLIGYYIAEGSSNRAYIRFSLGNHEEKFAKDIISLIKKLFNIDASIHRRNLSKGRTGLEVTACHSYLANIFENLCGKGAGNKHIPFVWQELPQSQQEILLEAMHRGDGHNHIANKSKKLHKSIITVSRILAEQLVDILLRKNIFPSLIIQKEKVDKKGVHHKESYSVVWSETALSQHNFIFSSPMGSKYWLLPIKTLVKSKYEGPVYNLTVEKDHSYIATNFSVANCGEGGDIFGFVIKYENVEFKEALKILADKAGIKLPKYKPTNQNEVDEKEIIIRINNFAARFYHEILCSDTRGKEALNYLLERGLNKNTIDKWQIGFAPEDFHSLKNALNQKQVSELLAIKSGVLIKNERGQIYDRFRGRITFPISNHFGEAVGFTARILPRLDDGKMGKYINSPETLVYNKSKILFGLNFAKNAIRKQDEAIIVEGQMDVITASQAGYENLVASSGTTLTQEQLNALGRLTKNLKFCFDGDKAGILATRRAVENYLGQDFTIKIIELPEAKDPDELIKKSPAIWEKQVSSAKLFLDFFIDKSFEHFASSSIEQKKQVAKDLLPLIKKLTDPLEQDHYLQLLASRFGTIVNVLKQALQKITPTNKKNNTATSQPLANTDNLLTLEKNVVGGMLMKQKFLQTVVSEGSLEDFTNPEIKTIVQKLLSGEVLGPEIQNSTLAKEALFMVELQSNESASAEAFDKDLTKAFFLLRLNFLRKQLQRLNLEIKQAESANNKTLLKTLSSQFANFSNLRIKYEKQI